MNEQVLVKDAISEIFRKSGYGDTAKMRQRDFDYVADEIEKKSGIVISGITIKRLALGDFSRLPQVATLNAIANYFDYKTWQDFKTSRHEASTTGEVEVTPLDSKDSPDLKPKRKNLLFAVAILTLLAISTVYFLKRGRDTISNTGEAKFSCQRATTSEMPNTVVFNYDIDGVKADSFFIQQSWDRNRRVRIYKNRHTLTDIYYEPGYHIAKLIANDSVIKTIDIHIPTDRWFFYAIDNVMNYIPEYIKTESFIHDGILSLTKQQAQESNIDISKDKLYHYTYFPSEMKIKSDNFRLRTRIRMNELRNNLCPYISVELFCQGKFIVMRTTKKGCANKALLLLGQEIKGNEWDLTPLTFDVSQWADLEISVTNNMASISINNKEVFSAPCFDGAKYISGLAFISNGLCEVDKVELTGLDGTVVYKNEFE